MVTDTFADKVADKITDYYLIDMENLNLRALTGLQLPGAEAEIRIFISDAVHAATEEVRQDILASRASIDTFYCSVTEKNAMDFEIAAYFGAALSRPEVKHVAVISEDKGFAALADYARRVRKDVFFYQASSILEAYVAFREEFQKKPYVHAKGKRAVDFKQIMQGVKEKRQFEDSLKAVLQKAAGREDVSELLKQVTEIMAEQDGGAAYRALLHLLGRDAGLAVYRHLKNQS